MVSADYPVGVSDFAELVTGGYRFVDKTPLISHLCRNIGKRFMFARPHGFGKTLNLSMIDRFFNVEYAGEPDIFEGLQVENDQVAARLRNTIPVIRLDLGGLGDDLEYDLSVAVAEAFRPFSGLEGLHDVDERFIEDCLELRLNRAKLWMSVRWLCDILEHVHGKEPIVLIDDYDACFRDIQTEDRYLEVSSLIGTFMEQTFKHNTDMLFGAIFAEMPSLRTGMFGGFDSYCLCGIENREAEMFFGVSREEIQDLTDGTGSPSADVDDIERRFGGFRIGAADMLDPSGVMAFLNGDSEAGLSRRLSDDVITSFGAVPLYALRDLIENPNRSVVTVFDHMVSRVEATDPTAGLSQVCSYLSMAGFLRAESMKEQIDGMPLYRYSIPNIEICRAMSSLVDRAGFVENLAKQSMDAICDKNPKSLEEQLSELFRLVSPFISCAQQCKSIEHAQRYRDIIKAYLVTPKQIADGIEPIAEYPSGVSYAKESEHPPVLIGVDALFRGEDGPVQRMPNALRQTELMQNSDTDAIRIDVVVGEGSVAVRFA